MLFRSARSEPRLLELVGRETSVPVPDVYGYVDAHEKYPAPFYLMEYVEGDVMHAYAACDCGTTYSEKWVVDG